jgi:hypothetical protein
MAHIRVDLRKPENSYAYLSERKDKQAAIVFVHGLDGDAYKTWIDFQTLADSLEMDYPLFATSDLYFFKYPSWEQKNDQVASNCVDFIRALFPGPPSTSIFSTSLETGSASFEQEVAEWKTSLLPSQYNRLILVGHSKGGQVLRLLIWNAFRVAYDRLRATLTEVSSGDANKALKNADPLLGADVCLFSPAIFGSDMPALIGDVVLAFAKIPGFGQLFLAALGLALPTLKDLDPHDQTSSDVRKFTEEYYRKFDKITAFKARILWGGKDKHVNRWQYEFDSPIEFAHGIGHTQVCKPNANFLDPLEFLCYGRKSKAASTLPG